MERESLRTFPRRAAGLALARFELFRSDRRSQGGCLVVRQGPVRIWPLPITPARARHRRLLPAPHGLAGFAAPVERDLPSLVPYLELVAEDDRTPATAPTRFIRRPTPCAARRVAPLGHARGETRELDDPGLTSDVRGRCETRARARETLTARAPIVIRTWRLIVPQRRRRRATATGMR